MDKAVNRVGHLLRLVKVVKVAGVRDPLYLDERALGRYVGKNGFRLGRVAVGLQLQHPEGEIVLANFSNGGCQIPITG